MISLTYLNTPLGKMIAGATEKGICLLEFNDEKRVEKHIKYFNKFGYNEITEQHSPHFSALKKQLSQYFNKKLTDFDLRLDIIGTPFQIKVWTELLKIPYGTTKSYKEQAISIGDLKAIRAVAKANGDNKVAIVIPCHRVIGSNGSLTGYGGGINRKEILLNLESNQLEMFEITIP